MIKDGSRKTFRPSEENYELSDEEFTTYLPSIMTLFKANNKRKKAKAALVTA